MKIKEEDNIPAEQMALMIMDNFRGQDNNPLKELLDENQCVSRIVPHNLTNWFQPLDISVNKPSKSFVTNKYNTWFSDEVAAQLRNGTDPADVNVSTKLSDMKPLHARWISDLYQHLRGQKDIIMGLNLRGSWRPSTTPTIW